MNNTEESNKVIAQFMANHAVNSPHLKEGWELEYDRSWSSLMPVVEKIEGNVAFEVSIANCTCTISAPDEHQKDAFTNVISDVCYPEAKSKIEAVYIAVCRFILWYNTSLK